MKDETLAVHAGFRFDPTTHAVAPPIYQTVAYAFDNAQHGADLFNLAVPGNIYTRIMNPTTDVLEQRCAQLEGGLAALGLSAGSAAVNYSILNIAEQGNNIVTVPLLYGGTWTLFQHMLPRLGIEVRFAKSDNASDLAALIDDKTSAVFCESIGNPAGNIVDVEALADMAHAAGVPLIVDNTVATPVLMKPIEWGADIIVNTDADNHYDQSRIAELVAPLLAREADITIGSRLIDELPMKAANKYGNKVANYVMQRVLSIPDVDVSTGCA